MGTELLIRVWNHNQKANSHMRRQARAAYQPCKAFCPHVPRGGISRGQRTRANGEPAICEMRMALLVYIAVAAATSSGLLKLVTTFLRLAALLTVAVNWR